MKIFVVVNGEQRGPLADEEVQNMLESGELKLDDPALREGDSEWGTVARFVEPPKEVSSAEASEPSGLPPELPPVMGTNIEIIQKEEVRVAKITLNNETFRTEAGAMYYMRGNITMESKAPSVGGFLKAAISGESIFRPTYSGTGELYLEPTAYGIHTMDLKGETWILENGSYYGSEMGVAVDVHREKALTAFKSGEGFLDFQTKISGTGKVLVKAPGPVEEVHLQNDKLVVDGSFAFARSATLAYSCERATKSIIGSVTSGEGMVRIYQGTGTVLMSPFMYYPSRVLDSLSFGMQQMGK